MEEIEGKSYKALGFSSNPFVLFPKDLVKSFINRENEKRQFYRYMGNLLNNQNEGIAILGRHGIGKSHFIKVIYKKVEEVANQLDIEKVFFVKGLTDFKDNLLPKKTTIIQPGLNGESSIVIETSPILSEIKSKKGKRFLVFIDDLDLIFNRHPNQVVMLFAELNQHIIGAWNTGSWALAKNNKSIKLPSCDTIMLDNLYEETMIKILGERIEEYATNRNGQELFSEEIKRELAGLSSGVPFTLIKYANSFLDYLIENNITKPSTQDYFNFTNKHNIISFSQIKNEIEKLTDKQKEILRIILRREETNATELAELIGVARVTAREHLHNLAEKHILESKTKEGFLYFYIDPDFTPFVEKAVEERPKN